LIEKIDNNNYRQYMVSFEKSIEPDSIPTCILYQANLNTGHITSLRWILERSTASLATSAKSFYQSSLDVLNDAITHAGFAIQSVDNGGWSTHGKHIANFLVGKNGLEPYPGVYGGTMEISGPTTYVPKIDSLLADSIRPLFVNLEPTESYIDSLRNLMTYLNMGLDSVKFYAGDPLLVTFNKTIADSIITNEIAARLQSIRNTNYPDDGKPISNSGFVSFPTLFRPLAKFYLVPQP